LTNLKQELPVAAMFEAPMEGSVLSFLKAE
jgi:hypothetical protein